MQKGQRTIPSEKGSAQAATKGSIMNKEILKRFAELKIEAKRIDNEIEFLQPEVLKEIQAISTTDPVQVDDLGVFSLRSLKKWHFSEELLDMKVKVTEKEAEEKANGTAKFEESTSVSFKELIK